MGVTTSADDADDDFKGLETTGQKKMSMQHIAQIAFSEISAIFNTHNSK